MKRMWLISLFKNSILIRAFIIIDFVSQLSQGLDSSPGYSLYGDVRL